MPIARSLTDKNFSCLEGQTLRGVAEYFNRLLRDGVLSCSWPDLPEPVLLVATADDTLVDVRNAVFLRTRPASRVEGVTEGGSTLYRHTPRAPGFVPPDPAASNLVPIEEHLETHLGPVDFVWHELVSDLVHIDIHVIRPSPDRPW